MALALTSVASNVAAPVNFVMMRGLLNAAKRTFPYYAGSVPGDLESMSGSFSVKWERIENLTAAVTALGEVSTPATFGMGRDAVQPTITRPTATVQKYGNAIMTTEEVDLVNVNVKAMRFVDTLGENAGHSLNILQRNVFNAETTARFSGGVANTSLTVTAITVNDIKNVVNTLNRGSAMKFFPDGFGSTNIGTSPIRASYYGITHVDVEENIRALTGFIPVEQYGGYTNTEPGEYGTLGGVRWISTEVAPVESGGGVTSVDGFNGLSANANDVYATFIFGREAVGSVGLDIMFPTETYMGGDVISPIELIQHAPGSSGVGDMFNEVGSLAWKAHHAGKVLNSTWVKKIETLATSF